MVTDKLSTSTLQDNKGWSLNRSYQFDTQDKNNQWTTQINFVIK